jgi:hypothetical protein
MTNPDMDGQSDKAWRVFTLALMWCNENGTDGVVPRRAFRFLHPDGLDESVIEELIAASLVVDAEDGFVMPGWSTELGQSSAESVRQARENNRQRQARYRERHASESDPGLTDPVVTDDVTRYVTGDQRRESRHTSKARQGKEVVNSTIYESGPTVAATLNWSSRKIPNAVCIVCEEPFASPDPGRFAVCPAQDDAHAEARAAA